MVHAHGHHGQEQGGGDVAGHDAHDEALTHADLLHDPAQAGGDVAGDGHDHQDVRHQADDEGQQRGEHDVQRLGHILADELLHIAQAPHADDSGQDAAAAGAQDGIQRLHFIVQTQDPGDRVDVAKAGDHAQHTAQDGGGAELLGGPVASPCRQVAQECGVDQGQKVVNDAPEGAFGIVGHHLGHQGSQARAQAGRDDAGQQGHKDVSEGLEHTLDLALLLARLDSRLVGLPVVFGIGTARSGDAHAAADVGALAAFAGAHHDLHIAGPVVHHPEDALDLLDGFLVDLACILDLDPQSGHAVGGRDDILFAAQIFQRLPDQFFIGHCLVLLFDPHGFIRQAARAALSTIIPRWRPAHGRGPVRGGGRLLLPRSRPAAW